MGLDTPGGTSTSGALVQMPSEGWGKPDVKFFLITSDPEAMDANKSCESTGIPREPSSLEIDGVNDHDKR